MKYIIPIFLLLSIIYPRREFDTSNPHHLDNNRSCGQRPVLDYSILSASEKFVIHYNYYYDGIEDYANSVALSADSSRKVIVDIMNFRPEIPDEDNIYDIYIKELPNGSYGWNCPDNDIGSSWIEIDDNYIGFNYSTTGEDAMKISVAHEFFHAVQRAYVPTPGSNSFFYELSSIWIEDIIYPDINDYISFSQFGDDYFSNPNKNMNQYNGYGLGLYPHYMNFIFDNQIMQRIWEQLSVNQEEDIFSAINNVLNDSQYSYNSSFVQTWLDFNTRNLFNGLFSNMNNQIYYYEDQILFNPIATSPLDINEYLESYEDEWEIFEYETNVNNKSVDIRSFTPSQNNAQEFLFNVNQDNSYVTFSLISENQNQINLFSDSNNLNYILDNNDIFHFVYISDDNSNNINTIIQKRDKQSSYEIACYPNPINLGQNLTLRLSSGIEISNLRVGIFNIKGQLIKNISLGEFSYSNQDFNEISFSIFNSYTSSGLYILKLYLDDYTVSKKIVYLK